jgi:hypothetical protein
VGNPGFRGAARLAMLELHRPNGHYAFYEFTNVDEARAATDPSRIAPLVADFDRVWGDRVTRRREILEIVQETMPSTS